MKIYIEYSTFTKFKNIVLRCEKLFKNKSLKFVIKFFKNVSIKPYRYLRKKKYFNIEYDFDAKYRLKKLIKLSNYKRRPLQLSINIYDECSKYMKKLNKIEKLTCVYDKSNLDSNYEKLSKSGYLLVRDKNHDDIYEYDMLNLFMFGQVKYQCKYSSCLYENIYINKNDIASFCPKNPNDSLMGNFFLEDNIFELKSFDEFASRAVEKRDNCKKECPFYYKCMGGCFMEDDCIDIKKSFENIKSLYQSLKNKESLEGMPYKYKSLLIRQLCLEMKYR